ncbi:hypothetical protein DL93DRAFT_2229147 [Clavulina sp. PMI_390]|nr:hypothetical protein DL93DRAFT_2229147 [Clavulina sp. PMI_390]
MAPSVDVKIDLSALSTQVDAMVASLNALIPSELPNILQLGRAEQANHKAGLASHIARLDQVHDQFQAVMQKGLSAVARLRSRINAARSPIYILPVETISEIFQLVATEDTEDDFLSSKHQPDGVLRLSLVSSAWRSIVLGCVDFFTASPNWNLWPLWLCQEWYSRSHDRLVTISLDYDLLTATHNKRSSSKVFHAISKLAPRTGSLTVHGPADDTDAVHNLISNPQLLSLSHLTLLHFTFPVILPPSICYNLRSINLSNSSIAPVSPESGPYQFNSLERLHVVFSPYADLLTPWVYIVDAAPRISELQVTSTATEDDDHQFPVHEFIYQGPNSALTLQTLGLENINVNDAHLVLEHWGFPKLKQATFDNLWSPDGNWHCGATFSLLNHAAPNLISLQLIGTQQWMKAAVNALIANFEILTQIMDLTLKNSYFDWATQPRDGSRMETELLALVKLRHFKKLTLYFPILDEVLHELRKHADTVEIIEFILSNASQLN